MNAPAKALRPLNMSLPNFDFPNWEFEGLQPFKYRVILADPAYVFKNWSDKGAEKSPQAHYTCMTVKEIKALPVAKLAHDDCLLVMWTTAPMLPQSLEIMREWGFTYSTAGAWAKQSSTGKKWAFGNGHVLRSAAEFFLIGKKNAVGIESASVRNLIVSPIREYSRKPDQQYDICEQLTRGPYCELFSRTDREGWDSWGNEKGRFNADTPPS